MDIVNDSLIANSFLGVVTLLLLTYYYLTSTYSYWRDRGILYSKPTFLFGNFKEIFLRRKSTVDIQRSIYQEFGGEKFAGYFIFRQPVLQVRDPNIIEKVLIKDFTHFHDRGMISDPEYEPLSMNLFNAHGDYWRSLRYKLTPTFSSGKLKGMFEQIYNCGDHLMQELQVFVDKGEDIETKTVLSIFTTDVIATCAFGLQLKANSPEGITFRNMMNKMFSPTSAQIFRFFFRTIYPNLSKCLKFTTFPKVVNEYFLGLTKATIKLREQEGIKRNDFVQLLMNLKKEEQLDKTTEDCSELPEEDTLINQMKYTGIAIQHLDQTKLFTDNCIAAQSFVFLTAGSDSTSAALSFALYALSTNMNVQQLVQAEVDQALATHGKWSYDTFKDMTYLDQVIQESMRMYPIAAIISRVCTIPYQLPGTDIVLEKGQRISIPVCALHMDPHHYPNPDVFDPERFRGNNYKPSATFLPFGHGPRICIAMRFAILEMKVCLARILSQYTVSLNNKTQQPLRFVPGTLIVQALGGIWVNFQKRPKRE